jgi:transposase InsO family protein
VAFSRILPDEKKESAISFLKAAVAYYKNLGVAVARVMTDNGSCYISKAFRKACSDFGLRHIRHQSVHAQAAYQPPRPRSG